ncbi:MAG TPA: glycosyltransferase family 39 protein [Candidatus Eisenbacteria bacterium]|nr:glycosyltransferase family 39 protein [Candidatus Eisenbacteria bacterium]
MTDFRVQKSSLPDLAYLAALSLFFMISGLGRGSLASWDEALYASVAKEMVLRGDWLHLTFGGEAWTDKPPLAIWATAFFYKFFGINELTSRLFSALCGAGTVLVTYLLGRRLFNRWTGLLAALVLLNSTHFLRFARFGMLDGPLTLFITLCLYFFWRGRERNRYFIFSGVALGLAFMTKGFAAFLVFPVIFLHCLLAGEMELLARSSYWIGVMVAVAIALPWHLYDLLSSQGAFMQDVIVKHLFERTTSAVEGHAGNWYFYIRTFINKYHPWVLIGIFSAPFFLFKALKERRPEFVFTSAWIFGIWAVITMIRTKLGWYILPLYPALSVTVGWMLARWIKEKRAVLIQVVFIGAMALHVPYSHLWNADYAHAIKGIAPEVVERVPAGETVHLYKYHGKPEAVFYLGRPIDYLETDDELVAAVKKGGAFHCLAFQQDLAAVSSRCAALGVGVTDSFENIRLLGRGAKA